MRRSIRSRQANPVHAGRTMILATHRASGTASAPAPMHRPDVARRHRVGVCIMSAFPIQPDTKMPITKAARNVPK